ncbi:MAG: divergent PAP2 family protein [Cyanobium sp.]|jgi:acid phosphatase family membrane protein YuiD|nr:divergent PAP2 family protein [Synechococcaceae cyanobacterium]
MTLAVTLPSDLYNSQPLVALLDNAVLWWGLAACGFAQLSKLGIELVVHRRWRPAVLTETGGMPSSHSALITGTAAGLGWERGFEDPLFALAASLCFIILYDASGVRFMAGRIAARVNALPIELWPTPPGDAVLPLKENLGHTRLEVLVGSLIGPAIALPGLVWLGSPLRLLLRLGAWPG